MRLARSGLTCRQHQWTPRPTAPPSGRAALLVACARSRKAASPGPDDAGSSDQPETTTAQEAAAAAAAASPLVRSSRRPAAAAAGRNRRGSTPRSTVSPVQALRDKGIIAVDESGEEFVNMACLGQGQPHWYAIALLESKEDAYIQLLTSKLQPLGYSVCPTPFTPKVPSTAADANAAAAQQAADALADKQAALEDAEAWLAASTGAPGEAGAVARVEEAQAAVAAAAKAVADMAAAAAAADEAAAASEALLGQYDVVMWKPRKVMTVYSHASDKLVDREVAFSRGTGGATLLLHCSLDPSLAEALSSTYYFMEWRQFQPVSAVLLNQHDMLPAVNDLEETFKLPEPCSESFLLSVSAWQHTREAEDLETERQEYYGTAGGSPFGARPEKGAKRDDSNPSRWSVSAGPTNAGAAALIAAGQPLPWEEEQLQQQQQQEGFGRGRGRGRNSRGGRDGGRSGSRQQWQQQQQQQQDQYGGGLQPQYAQAQGQYPGQQQQQGFSGRDRGFGEDSSGGGYSNGWDGGRGRGRGRDSGWQQQRFDREQGFREEFEGGNTDRWDGGRGRGRGRDSGWQQQRFDREQGFREEFEGGNTDRWDGGRGRGRDRDSGWQQQRQWQQRDGEGDLKGRYTDRWDGGRGRGRGRDSGRQQQRQWQQRDDEGDFEGGYPARWDGGRGRGRGRDSGRQQQRQWQQRDGEDWWAAPKQPQRGYAVAAAASGDESWEEPGAEDSFSEQNRARQMDWMEELGGSRYKEGPDGLPQGPGGDDASGRYGASSSSGNERRWQQQQGRGQQRQQQQGWAQGAAGHDGGTTRMRQLDFTGDMGSDRYSDDEDRSNYDRLEGLDGSRQQGFGRQQQQQQQRGQRGQQQPPRGAAGRDEGATMQRQLGFMAEMGSDRYSDDDDDYNDVIPRGSGRGGGGSSSSGGSFGSLNLSEVVADAMDYMADGDSSAAAFDPGLASGNDAAGGQGFGGQVGQGFAGRVNPGKASYMDDSMEWGVDEGAAAARDVLQEWQSEGSDKQQQQQQGFGGGSAATQYTADLSTRSKEGLGASFDFGAGPGLASADSLLGQLPPFEADLLPGPQQQQQQQQQQEPPPVAAAGTAKRKSRAGTTSRRSKKIEGADGDAATTAAAGGRRKTSTRKASASAAGSGGAKQQQQGAGEGAQPALDGWVGGADGSDEGFEEGWAGRLMDDGNDRVGIDDLMRS